MRALFLALLLLFTVPAQANDFWNSLWRNADQRGEHLLKYGHAARAAKTYHDPRRKAYAELRAGDYQNAAKDFSAFDDSDGNYNRGNALAHSGQLQEALKAYDAALAHDPNNLDARHNRDLVAKALKQQPPQPQSSSDKNSSSKDGKDGKNGGKGSSAPEKDGKQGDKNHPDKQDAGKQDNARQNSSGKDQNGKDQQGKTGQGKSQSAQDMQNQNAQSGSNEQMNAAKQADDAAQAKRDAEAALGKQPQGKSATPSDTPLSEQQLAQEQWLRRIPDDPGGLLRRKFMIEHMIRQQGGQP